MRTHISNPDKPGKTFCGLYVKDVDDTLKHPDVKDIKYCNVCKNCKAWWMYNEKKFMENCFIRITERQYKGWDEKTIYGIDVIYLLREIDKIGDGILHDFFNDVKVMVSDLFNEETDPQKSTHIDITFNLDDVEILEYSDGICIVPDEKIKYRKEFLVSIAYSIFEHHNELMCMPQFRDFVNDILEKRSDNLNYKKKMMWKNYVRY